MEGFNRNKQKTETSKDKDLEKIKAQILTEGTFILKICNKMLGGTNKISAAEDLANESLFKAYTSATNYDQNKSNLHTWLASIARHTVVDYLRKANRDLVGRGTENIEDHFDIAEKGQSAEDLIIEKERKEIFMEAFKKLPENYQEALTRDFRGLSPRESATELNIPESTAKTWVSRGRRELAKFLGQDPKNLKIIRSRKGEII